MISVRWRSCPRHRGTRLVEAPGIENERGRSAGTISRRGGTIRHEGAPGSVLSRAFKCPDGGGAGTEASQSTRTEYELRDVVEPALARALLLAAEAQRWDVVLQIARELEARRERSGDCAVEPARLSPGGTGVRGRRPPHANY